MIICIIYQMENITPVTSMVAMTTVPEIRWRQWITDTLLPHIVPVEYLSQSGWEILTSGTLNIPRRHWGIRTWTSWTVHGWFNCNMKYSVTPLNMNCKSRGTRLKHLCVNFVNSAYLVQSNWEFNAYCHVRLQVDSHHDTDKHLSLLVFFKYSVHVM